MGGVGCKGSVRVCKGGDVKVLCTCIWRGVKVVCGCVRGGDVKIVCVWGVCECVLHTKGDGCSCVMVAAVQSKDIMQCITIHTVHMAMVVYNPPRTTPPLTIHTHNPHTTRALSLHTHNPHTIPIQSPHNPLSIHTVMTTHTNSNMSWAGVCAPLQSSHPQQ